MGEIFDILTRIGQIGVGVVFVLLVIAGIIVFFIELIDWLVVDPVLEARENTRLHPAPSDCDCPRHTSSAAECFCYCSHD